MRCAAFLLAALSVLLAGCGPAKVNPSFDLTETDANVALAAMQAEPRPLARPLLILGGYADPGFSTSGLSRDVRSATDDDRIMTQTFAFQPDFDACRKRAIDAVEAAFPSPHPDRTIDVDVVAVSMGGLIARYSALKRPGERRLRIVRLFTIATPHRGARMAWFPTPFDELSESMRRDSAILAEINEQPPDYEIIPYGMLRDAIVGVENTSPPREEPWWLEPGLGPAHLGAFLDPRLRADILRTLRGEEAYRRWPRTPLPGTEPAPG